MPLPSHPLSLRARVLLPVTLAALAAYVVVLTAFGDLRAHGYLVAGAALALGVPFAFLARELWTLRGASRALWLYVIVGATLLRLPLLYTQPSLSDDVYRYVWDGKQQRHGVNPYRHAPEAPAVHHLRDPLWERVNNKDVPTIYPPASQAVFLAADAVRHSVRAQKAAGLLFDLALIFALGALCDARGVPRVCTVLYAWHPLPLVEIAASGHNDSVGLFFLVLGLVLYERGRDAGSLAALAGSTLTKFIGGVAAPLVALRLPRKQWIVFPAVLLLAYLPYAGAGTQLFTGLGTFAAHWEFNGGLFRLAETALHAVGITDPRVALKVTGAVAGLGVLVYCLRSRVDPVRGTLWLMAFALLVSPTVHPWYVLWCLPLLACVPSRGLLCWTFTVSLAYHVMPAYAATGLWRENPWLVAIEYVPVFALLVLDARRPIGTAPRSAAPA